jgi:hypothetical protein
MLSVEQVARIRHLFHAEHWKIGTIAAELGCIPTRCAWPWKATASPIAPACAKP